MSDREIVTIEKTQYDALHLRLRSIADRLGPESNELNLHQVLTHLETTLNRLATTMSGGDNSQVLTSINNLSRKVDVMSSNIDRIEKEAADAAENVGLVRTAIEELKSASAAMQEEIASLKDQVVKGQLDQARLDAAAAMFEKADEDIDAIVLPGTPTEPPAES